MSLRDDLESVKLSQTKGYKEETSSTIPTESRNLKDSINTEEESSTSSSIKNPFKSSDGSSLNLKKIGIFGGAILIILAIGIVLLMQPSNSEEDIENEGASFLQDLYSSTFEYSLDERELLRANGYTGTDIERYQIEERSVDSLIEDARLLREKLYDEEVKPYLDGASDKYKELERLTWIGLEEVKDIVFNSEVGGYEERYGVYNVDYTKIPARGSQLFIKIKLLDFADQVLFMTVTPERYKELFDEGNMVVVIEYNSYSDGSIIVTNVYEKDIRS